MLWPFLYHCVDGLYVIREPVAIPLVYSSGPVLSHAEALTCNDVYRQVSNIRRTLVGNKTVDHSDVVGASPVGAAPTTSSLST